VYQKGVVEVAAKRADLVIALDISRSMRAKDLYPNRLEFAKKKIEELIKKSHNLAIGLIAFGDNAFIVSPITPDKEALLYLLRHLDTSMLSMKGTNIDAALLSAKLLFGDKKAKNILLVTDGGDKKSFKNEIELAKKEGFRVYVLGVGTKKGAPIEEGGKYITNEKGDIVIVKLNERIAELAKATGGVFVKATLSNDDVNLLLKKIGGFQKENVVEKVVDQMEFYPYFLIVALLFLFVAFFDIPTKNIAFSLMLLPLFAHSGILDFEHIKAAKEAYASGHYEEAAKEFSYIADEKRNAQAYYDLGNAYYKAKKYKKAIETYKKVQTGDRELEFKKLHNLGNSYFMLQNYDKAIEMYQKALAIKDDPDTRFNLELAKKMKKKKRQKQKSEPQQKKQNQQQQQNKKENRATQKQKREKSGKQKKGESSKRSGKTKNAPISDREEKKWQKSLEKRAMPTLLYRAPVKPKKEGRGHENPW
jgi:Ca-activated chloride channel family protein